ncbi:MAG TPA: hypothetical protein VFR78_11525 [Pyrinomonadaceae bacterium]|nr:hypothetical protein [Pyrinomonadaceae bacterium]
MKKTAATLFVMCLVVSALVAQTGKPWLEWNMKETTRVLNDSAWGQTQLETKEADGGAAAITNTGSSRSMVPRDASKDSPGAITSYIKYYIRLLSAKPIRQAVVRKLMLDSPDMDVQRKEQLQSFADARTSDFIVIAVVAEAKDRSMGGQALQAFSKATLESLRNSTYLERRDGQRVPLVDFKAPISDGLGAKFIFPRMLNNQPFLDAGSGQLKFYCELSKEIKLEARYKVSDMTYDGQLEY